MNLRRHYLLAFFALYVIACLSFAGAPLSAQSAAAGSDAPAAKPADPNLAYFEQLTPYQRSQVERFYTDWGFLAKFREEDKALPSPAPGQTRVVFMGDSITEGWGMKGRNGAPDRGVFFPGKPYLNRGISGQTTPQMLLRFRQDVIDLKPKVVVILAGTNDLAENTGKMSPEETEENLASMHDLARANGIRTVFCSVLPSTEFWWHKGLEPAPKIKSLNVWIKEYAQKHGLVYVDYYSPMVNEEGGLKKEYSPDGVHPNAAGYAIMAPLAEAGLSESLKKPLR
ncbi:MAG TPA: SGNH/GDSL hydrolase family protein [Candidatus Acidoferrum sp.]|nr:SGNH/GDSL hydrolase family protein [Candidatus Acidoferrum sp.]